MFKAIHSRTNQAMRVDSLNSRIEGTPNQFGPWTTQTMAASPREDCWDRVSAWTDGMGRTNFSTLMNGMADDTTFQDSPHHPAQSFCIGTPLGKLF